MNNYIKYDEFYGVMVGDQILDKVGFPKPNQKTIRITKGEFTAIINVENIKIPSTLYWDINGYDHQFDGYDANCWLCGWYGMDYGKCKCKKYFTIEEHKVNILTARRNYLITLCKNYFKDKVAKVKLLTNQQIKELLFDDSSGIRRQQLYFPHWSNRNVELDVMYNIVDNIK